MIKFENVGMRYGLEAEALKDISFQLDTGSFHFLTGPSGAGKTSLLRLLYLSHRPSRGMITFFGQNLAALDRAALPALRRRIGVVFQDFRLLDHLTALENVALPLHLTGGDHALIAEHAEELLVWVGLQDQIHAKPPTLSGGEKQRLAIARAVIGRPDLLIADEPTGNVDPDMAERIMHLFVELNKIGTTTIIATHDLDLVDRMNSNQIMLEKGELLRHKRVSNKPTPPSGDGPGAPSPGTEAKNG